MHFGKVLDHNATDNIRKFGENHEPVREDDDVSCGHFRGLLEREVSHLLRVWISVKVEERLNVDFRAMVSVNGGIDDFIELANLRKSNHMATCMFFPSSFFIVGVERVVS